jgi:hypothetical protein
MTVVEAVIALVLGVLVVGTVVALLLSGATWFKRTEDRLDARERAHLALAALRAALSDCWDYQIEEGGNRIRFLSPRGQGEARFEPASGSLLLARGPAGRSPERLASAATGFRIEETRRGYVKIALQLGRPAGPRSLPPLVLIEEVHMPAVPAPVLALPWNDPLSQLAPTGAEGAAEPSGIDPPDAPGGRGGAFGAVPDAGVGTEPGEAAPGVAPAGPPGLPAGE